MRARPVIVAVLTAVTLAVTPAARADSATATPADRVASTVAEAAPDADVVVPAEQPGGALEAVGTEGLEVTIPAESDGQVAVDDGGGRPVQIGLPAEADAGDAAVSADGTVVYLAESGRPVDLAVQALEDGVRIQTVLNGPSAPRRYTYALDAGVSAEIAADGSVGLFVEEHGHEALAGLIAPPWAVDADGAPVPTWYELDDGALLQVVEFTEDTAFPVVADPTFGWSNFAPTVFFNKRETRSIANGGFGATAICAAVTVLTGPVGTAVCAVNAFTIVQQAVWAKNARRCVKVLVPTPVTLLARQYSGGRCR